MTNWNEKFRQNAGKAPAKIANTPKSSAIKEFPELTQEQSDKLEMLFSALIPLHKRKYSTLSLNEKRIVEFFCKRYKITKSGKPANDGEEVFTVLKLSAYAHKFLIRGTGMKYFSMPGFLGFHIYEDVRMNIDELYGDPFEYTGSPFHDALNSFPNNYLPIRASNGKSKIFAVYSSRKVSEVESYVFRERISVVPDEALYNNPLLPEDVTPKPVRQPKSVNKRDSNIRLVKEYGMMTPVVAALVTKYLESPEDFYDKYNVTEIITGDLVELLESFEKTQAFEEELRKL